VRGRPFSALLIGIALVCLAVALLAAWQIEAWRGRERETRLRGLHTIDGRVECHPEFRSSVLGTSRRICVYLPAEYPIELERRFPVLYMQDGQNVFDGATASVAGREWQVDEAAERLTAQGRIEPLIVVAVDSGSAEERLSDYTPTRDRSAASGGGADRYGRMLLEELKPWIDGRYRTRPGRESTGIAGSSHGGLFALYLGLAHPETFSRIAALSPSIWWDERFLVRFVDGLQAKPDTVVWTDVGTGEGQQSLEGARLLRDALLRKGWQQGVDLRYVEADRARPNEDAWARRMPEILSFFYGPKADAVTSPRPSAPPSLTSSPVPPSVG
jgi:predicted alpha/beta superfamily hydrolase